MAKIFHCPHCNGEINPTAILQGNNKKVTNCIVCGKSFEGSKKSKFCSNACRQRDKYARAKQITHTPLKAQKPSHTYK